MSREIKFRGWSISRKRMLGWDGYFLNNTCVNCEDLQSTKTWVVMQFTGLKDKHGKEIYEGDILRDSEDITKVSFIDGVFVAEYRTIGGKWSQYGNLSKYLIDHEGVVIGNIYENPELLEVKDK